MGKFLCYRQSNIRSLADKYYCRSIRFFWWLPWELFFGESRHWSTSCISAAEGNRICFWFALGWKMTTLDISISSFTEALVKLLNWVSCYFIICKNSCYVLDRNTSSVIVVAHSYSLVCFASSFISSYLLMKSSCPCEYRYLSIFFLRL